MRSILRDLFVFFAILVTIFTKMTKKLAKFCQILDFVFFGGGTFVVWANFIETKEK